MRYFPIVLCSLLWGLCTLVQAELPASFQELSAQDKQQLIWEQIEQSHQQDPLPDLSGKSYTDVLWLIKGLFQLAPTFDHSSDEVPEGRVKIIHANGAVGKVSLVPNSKHPFTGLYRMGGVGLARLSLATPPTDKSYIPAMAIKLFIDQQPSVNLQVMHLLEGQNDNWNFFANEFSNHIPHPTSWTLLAIEKIFEWTKDPANDLPLWHLAVWTSQGRINEIPVFPERIYFRPSESVKELISAQSREDFRLSLKQIPIGPLYEIYGLYNGREYLIGTLMLDSTLLASKYGDSQLFFQHQR